MTTAEPDSPLPLLRAQPLDKDSGAADREPAASGAPASNGRRAEPRAEVSGAQRAPSPRGRPKPGPRGRLAAGVAAVVNGAGSVAAATLAVLAVLCWVIVGLVAGFSRMWLDVLFAASGAVTLIMVIFIQHTTGRQFRALMLKLDELLRVDEDASDRYIGAEQTSLEAQEELEHDRDDRRSQRGAGAA